MAETASRAAFAATWRDDRGAVVGSTWGGTMCWWPVKPWRIKIARDGFEHVIRCGECPGCLEFDRLRLAARLYAKYGIAPTPKLANSGAACERRRQRAGRGAIQYFIVRIWAPLERHAAIAHGLHRRRGLALEPGLWRLGASSFALLSREKGFLLRVLRSLGLRFRAEPLRLGRGRRAFRSLTAGLLVSREIYGEQKNRWYARGLPPAERERWEVQKIGKYKSYDRARSPRAAAGNRVVLVPPTVWQLSRTDRRALRGQLLRQSDPEGVRRVMGLVADTIRKAGRDLPVSAAAQPRLTREQVARWYARNAERAAARTETAAADSSLPPLSEAGGYVSSEHNQGELMPRELEKERRREWRERRDRKLKEDSQAIIERMKNLARARGGNDDRNGGAD